MLYLRPGHIPRSHVCHFPFRSELLSLLKTYNCYHEGKSSQLRRREVRPRLSFSTGHHSSCLAKKTSASLFWNCYIPVNQGQFFIPVNQVKG